MLFLCCYIHHANKHTCSGKSNFFSPLATAAAAAALYHHMSTRALCTPRIVCMSIYNANVVIVDMCPMACWCHTALAGVMAHVAMFFHMIVMCGESIVCYKSSCAG